jgi:lysophospholipase L1-like esterase
MQRECPIFPEIFLENYKRILDRLEVLSKMRVLCVVAPTPGENPYSSIDKFFSTYMDVVRDAAHERGLTLVDFNAPFVEYLCKEGGGRDFSFLRCLYSHIMVRLFRRDPEEVASRQGLKLTFDSLHPNRKGAKLLARTLAPELKMDG